MKLLLKASIVLTVLLTATARAEIMSIPENYNIVERTGLNAPILTAAIERILAKILPYTEYSETHIFHVQENFFEWNTYLWSDYAEVEITGYLIKSEEGAPDLAFNADGPCYARVFSNVTRNGIKWTHNYDTVQISGISCPVINRWADAPMSINLKRKTSTTVELSNVY